MSPTEGLMIFPVLLAGGSGTRLWPVSRTQTPKQLVEFSGETSLLQETIQRLHPVLPIENVRVVCGEAHRRESTEHLAAIGLNPDDKIISEPVGRNTAPAILLSVMKILHQMVIQDALFFILPADHVIRDTSRFHQSIEKAIQLAKKGKLVTFGIQPEYPETGYGYIKGKKVLSDGGLPIEKFVEKPDTATAASYIQAGNYFWNSGMFAFRASAIMEEFKRLEPAMVASMTAIVEKGDPIPVQAYERLASKSFDVAIMEKTAKGVVLPSDFGWSDIGSWKALHAHLPKNDAGNVIAGDVVVHNIQNSLLIAKNRLLAVNDLSDIAIVETADAVFVSGLETSRNVRDIVSILKQQNRKEHRVHLLEKHNWGSIQYLEQSPETIVAKIQVSTEAVFAFPQHPSGHWHICLLSGQALVAYRREQHRLTSGQSLTLGAQSPIDLQNIGSQNLMGLIAYQQEV